MARVQAQNGPEKVSALSHPRASLGSKSSAPILLLASVFRSQFSVVGGILFTHTVGDSKLRWLLPKFVTVTFAPNSF